MANALLRSEGPWRDVQRRCVALLLLAGAVLQGCSGQASPPATTDRPDSTSTTGSTTTLAPTSPPTEPTLPSSPDATDEAAVRPVLEALIDQHDAAVGAILADPQVANDSDSAEIVAYVALFVPGSPFTEGAIEFWRNEAALGHFYRPGPLGSLADSSIESIEPHSTDRATVLVCTTRSVVVTDAAGGTVSSEGGMAAGLVDTVRVDGVWLLEHLTETSVDRCPPRVDQ